MDRPLRIAVAGLGGFAGSHHAALAEISSCQVVATCDPDVGAMGEAIERYRLAHRGVQILPDLDAVLALQPDVVTLPTPLPLHAEQHAAVLAAGAACYLEKPPSLWWPEYVAMTTRDEGARHATQVGFNFVGDPFRRALKRRILDGEFGPLREVSFLGLWPRDRAYYARNGWAGRLRVDGHPVFDSPLGNAMAHYVQNLLFWAGDDVDSVGRVEGVRAWLGRAHPIESYDTAFVAARLAGDVRLRVGATHTGAAAADRETVVLQDARIAFPNWRTARIEWADGRVETLESEIQDQGGMLRHNFEDYFAYVRGERARPTTTLADSEGFVRLCGLALASCPSIASFGPREEDDAGRVVVHGLEGRLRAFVDSGVWPADEPSESTGPL